MAPQKQVRLRVNAALDGDYLAEAELPNREPEGQLQCRKSRGILHA